LKGWQHQVLDRTGLILEIFGRAQDQGRRVAGAPRAFELSAQSPGAIMAHLGVSAAGFGFMGGPGETQIAAGPR